MATLYANNASTTLASSALAADTSLVLTSATGFSAPTGGDLAYATIESGSTREIVTYTGVTTNTLTGVTRGQDGTSAAAWASGATVEQRLTAAMLRGLSAQAAGAVHAIDPISGYALWSGAPGGSLASAPMAIGNARLTPLDITVATTITGIGTIVNSAGSAGSAPRLGIWTQRADGITFDLVLDAGAIDATTTGKKTITISLAVTARRYWLMFASQGSNSTLPQTVCMVGSAVAQQSANGNTPSCLQVYSTMTGAFPSTCQPTAIDSNGINAFVVFA